jgi:hypothetical protein
MMREKRKGINMSQWLLIGGVFVWFVALAWVLQDAYANFPITARVWWAVITLLLGPFAIPLYLSERLTRRAESNKIGHGKAAFTAPEGRRPFRDGRQRRFADVASGGSGGSGYFIATGEGSDAHQHAEIPGSGALIIRRGAPGEYSRSSVLVLRDAAASRDEHCRLWIANGHIMLADRSRWGTIVNDTRIQGTTVSVEPGTAVRIGQTTLYVQQGGN